MRTSAKTGVGSESKYTDRMESQIRALQEKVDSGVMEALLPLAFYLNEVGKYDESLAALERYRVRKEGDCHYYSCMGIIHFRNDDILNAKKSFDAASSNLELLSASQLVAAGSFYYEYNCLEASTDCYKMALNKEPSDYASLFAMAQISLSLGKQEEAIPLLLKAIEQNSNGVKALRVLSRLGKYQLDQKFYEYIDNVNKKYSRLSSAEKAEFHHTRKCIHERNNNFKDAYGHLQEANKSLMGEKVYRSRTVLNVFQRLRSHGEQLANMKDSTSRLEGDQRNLFIVGMPRSGTSLLESILGGHSKIYPLGELQFLGKIIGSSDILHKDKIDEDEVTLALSKYKLLVAELYQRKEQYVIDKLPMNFRFIPYILTGLQDAKVIHINRNKQDVCWSNYYNHLPASGLEYSYTIPTTFDYYTYYEKLMQYYNNFYPNNIYNVQYENLVLSPRKEIKKLTAWLGLQYEENCLDLKKNRNYIKTTSNVQVGDQIQQKKSTWHKFREFLPDTYFN